MKPCMVGQVEVVGGVDRDDARHRHRVARVDRPRCTAWAIVERTNATCSSPSTCEVVEVLASAPVRIPGSSRRRTGFRGSSPTWPCVPPDACDACAVAPDGGADYRARLNPRRRPGRWRRSMDGIAGVRRAHPRHHLAVRRAARRHRRPRRRRLGDRPSSTGSSATCRLVVARTRDSRHARATAVGDAACRRRPARSNRAGRRPGAVGEGLPHPARHADHRENVQAITAWEQAEGTAGVVQPARDDAGRLRGRDAVQQRRREELRELPGRPRRQRAR